MATINEGKHDNFHSRKKKFEAETNVIYKIRRKSYLGFLFNLCAKISSIILWCAAVGAFIVNETISEKVENGAVVFTYSNLVLIAFFSLMAFFFFGLLRSLAFSFSKNEAEIICKLIDKNLLLDNLSVRETTNLLEAKNSLGNIAFFPIERAPKETMVSYNELNLAYFILTETSSLLSQNKDNNTTCTI